MITVTNDPAGVGGKESSDGLSATGVVKTRPPAEFVYDNGQILLELLRERADAEDRRRFVSSLRRLRRGDELLETT